MYVTVPYTATITLKATVNHQNLTRGLIRSINCRNRKRKQNLTAIRDHHEMTSAVMIILWYETESERKWADMGTLPWPSTNASVVYIISM